MKTNTIDIILYDNTHIIMNNVVSACFIGDELIVLTTGIFGGIDTLVKDGTLIKSFTVERGK